MSVEAKLAFLVEEHRHPTRPHRVFQPRTCPECWGDQAEPIVEAPSPEPTLPDPSEGSKTAKRAPKGFTSLDGAVQRWWERRQVIDEDVVAEKDDDASPLDDFPYCTTCKGLRYVLRDLPVGHPEFGKLQVCPTCGFGIVVQRRLDAMFGELPSHWTDVSLDSFVAASPSQAFALSKVREWLADPGNPSLYLWSPSGRGKTHLAVGALRGWIESGHSGTFRLVDDLLTKIKNSFDQETTSAMLDALTTAQLLVLDDLGSEHHRAENDWASSEIFSIINARYDHNGRSIITSNYSLRELSAVLKHPRTASRIFEMATEKYVVDLSRLPDYRLVKGRQ